MEALTAPILDVKMAFQQGGIFIEPHILVCLCLSLYVLPKDCSNFVILNGKQGELGTFIYRFPTGNVQRQTYSGMLRPTGKNSDMEPQNLRNSIARVPERLPHTHCILCIFLLKNMKKYTVNKIFM